MSTVKQIWKIPFSDLLYTEVRIPSIALADMVVFVDCPFFVCFSRLSHILEF